MQRDLYDGEPRAPRSPTRRAACCGSRSAACPWFGRAGRAPQLVGLLTESDLLRAAYVPDFDGRVGLSRRARGATIVNSVP